jgi:chromosome partitioning protein
MKKIVFFNTKGGTGKTTVCYNYGWYLAQKKNSKVLLIDLDPQVNLVQAFGQEPCNEKGKNLDKLITDHIRGKKIAFDDYTISINDNIRLLPSSNNISLVEEYLMDVIIKKTGKSSHQHNASYRNRLLRRLFEMSIDDQDYDYVLIDSQPNFSLLSSVALIYARNIVVVARPDLFSFLDMDYLKKIINNLNKKYYTNIQINSIIVNAFEKRRNTSKEGVKSIIDKYGGEFNILENRIKYLSAFQTSISQERQPVFVSYPASEASKNIFKVFEELDRSVSRIY